MKGRLILSITIILLFCTPALADFQKGSDAAQRGDYAVALEEWKPLAELGDADAQYNLGVMYEDGLGVSQDHKAAIKWFSLAANQGHAGAQYQLGMIYELGKGVPSLYIDL